MRLRATQGGGFDSPIVPIDQTLSYMFVVYFRVNQTSTDGTFYFGTYGRKYDGVTGMHLHSKENMKYLDKYRFKSRSNPYFQTVHFNDLEEHEWYVAIGYLHGEGYAGSKVTKFGVESVEGYSHNFIGDPCFTVPLSENEQESGSYGQYTIISGIENPTGIDSVCKLVVPIERKSN